MSHMLHEGRVLDCEIQSQAIGRPMRLKVVLPPGYDRAKRVCPVLFFLHPWGLDPDYLVNKLRIHTHLWAGVAEGSLAPMVIALPAGEKSFFINAADPPGHDWSSMVDFDSRFFEHALQQYGRYGDYLLDEIIPYVEDHFHVRRDRAGQAIGGISLGGAAAAVHAFQNPGRFCALGIHSPALFFWTEEGTVAPPWIFGVDRTSFAARNPADLARKVADSSSIPRIYLDTGDADPMLPQVLHLHRELNRAGLAHEFAVNPGEHNKTYWEPQMRSYLAFYSREWKKTPG